MTSQLTNDFTARTTSPVPLAKQPRIIEFEGRRIEVLHDTTYDEIREILSAPVSQQNAKGICFDDLIPQQARRQIMQKYGVRTTQVINLLDEAHDEDADPVKAKVLEDAKPLTFTVKPDNAGAGNGGELAAC